MCFAVNSLPDHMSSGVIISLMHCKDISRQWHKAQDDEGEYLIVTL